MASSKPGSRKAAPRKATTRKPRSAHAAPAAAAQIKKTASLPKAETTEQAAQGQEMSVSPVKKVTPPVALAAGQNPSPVVVTTSDAASPAPGLNKKELIDEAVLRSGVKKKDAKPVVEALLAVLGEAVAEGRDLNLRPFGKLRVNRSEARSNGTVHMCRLRQPLDTAQDSAVTEEKTEDLAQLSLRPPLAEAAG